MAQQTTVRFIDDIDGSDAVGTVTFSLDNRAYEIDLSDENTDKLHEALAPFIEHGRKAGGRSGGRGRTRGQAPMTETPARSNREETARDPRVGPAERSPGERPRAHLEVGDGGVQGRQLSRWAAVSALRPPLPSPSLRPTAITNDLASMPPELVDAAAQCLGGPPQYRLALGRSATHLHAGTWRGVSLKSLLDGGRPAAATRRPGPT